MRKSVFFCLYYSIRISWEVIFDKVLKLYWFIRLKYGYK